MTVNRSASVRRQAAAGLIAVLVTGALAPAASAETVGTSGDENCILVTELAREICAPIGEDLHAKVQEETGLTVIETTDATRARRLASTSAVSAAATYVTVRFYDDLNYGGSSREFTSSSPCDGTTVKSTADIGSSWYGRVSSFAVYSGCTVKIYESTSFGGASYGYAGSTSYVGSAMNDRTRSFRAK